MDLAARRREVAVAHVAGRVRGRDAPRARRQRCRARRTRRHAGDVAAEKVVLDGGVAGWRPRRARGVSHGAPVSVQLRLTRQAPFRSRPQIAPSSVAPRLTPTLALGAITCAMASSDDPKNAPVPPT